MAPWAHSEVRSLAIERDWEGWDDFFKSGSLLLASVSPFYSPQFPGMAKGQNNLQELKIQSSHVPAPQTGSAGVIQLKFCSAG